MEYCLQAAPLYNIIPKRGSQVFHLSFISMLLVFLTSFSINEHSFQSFQSYSYIENSRATGIFGCKSSRFGIFSTVFFENQVHLLGWIDCFCCSKILRHWEYCNAAVLWWGNWIFGAYWSLRFSIKTFLAFILLKTYKIRKNSFNLAPIFVKYSTHKLWVKTCNGNALNCWIECV